MSHNTSADIDVDVIHV